MIQDCLIEQNINSINKKHVNITCSSRKSLFIGALLAFIIFFIFFNFSTYQSINLFEKNRTKFISRNGFKKRLKVHGTQRRLPQAIIIGARKCGTRALLEMAALHPYVMKSSAEVHFFDDPEAYENGLEWYRKQMPYTFDTQVTIEKTPSYFVSHNAPYRIRAMNESVKLILIAREPVYRLISDYSQVREVRIRAGKEPIPLEQLLLTKDGEINTNYVAVQTGMYYLHMERWLRVFGRHQILVIDGEQLVRDPYSEVVKLEPFLNLPHRFSTDNFYFNKTKGFFCLRKETKQKCLAPSKGRSHAPVDPELSMKLREFYVPFNHKFFELIQKNFSWNSVYTVD